jgi:hypothetical protein
VIPEVSARLLPKGSRALDLQFQPERLVYDPEQGLMWFFATEGTVSVECAISMAALAALAHLALQGPNAMMSTFQQHQKLIQKIAEDKYRASQFDSRGKVIVDLEDLDS